MTMSGHYVNIRKRQLKERLSCPLCCKLLREATTICECLHTFCKEFIYQKLLDEDTYCCPVCDVYLGCVPVEKLRPDNNLQDVRTKIFPLKRRKMKAPEIVPLISPPAKWKERSLSSLVINTPPVLAQVSLSSRTKVVARKAVASRGIVSKTNSGRDVDVTQDQSERLDSLERSRRQRNSGGEPLNQTADDDRQNTATQDVSRQRTGKAANWEPLACLAEAANRTETSQLPMLGLHATGPDRVFVSIRHPSNIPEGFINFCVLRGKHRLRNYHSVTIESIISYLSNITKGAQRYDGKTTVYTTTDSRQCKTTSFSSGHTIRHSENCLNATNRFFNGRIKCAENDGKDTQMTDHSSEDYYLKL